MSALNDFISQLILVVAGSAGTFWRNVTLVDFSAWQVFFDILLVAVLFYWMIRLLSGSRAINIILGLIILAALFLVSKAFELVAMSWLLSRLFTVILVAIPIIFQQELRAGLEKLGRTKFFLAQEKKEIDFLISEVVEACLAMAEHRIGALLVFRGEVSLTEYVESGVMLNAKISKELIRSIFSKNAPLHDGAVIIEDGLVVAAGVTLPQSFRNYGHAFGTRHKAALAVSEATDARVIVISEERGTISLAFRGTMEQGVKAEQIQQFLEKIYRKKKPTHA
ncbi:MAG: diadenylate cyclase CdaA [Patescibacteria group bacterium]